MPDEVRQWYLYVVQCKDGTLYTGITVDVCRRIRQHNRGRGAAYTAARRPVVLLAVWPYEGRAAALRAESAFKALNRQHKMDFALNRRPFQGSMAILPSFFGDFSS